MRPSLEGSCPIEKEHFSNGRELNLRVDTRPFIDNTFYELSDKQFTLRNPSTNEAIVNVSLGGGTTVRHAIEAARRAFDSGPWPRMSARERSRTLIRFADLIEENAEYLGTVEALNVGKLLTACIKHEAGRAAANIRFFAKNILHWNDDGAWLKDVVFLGKEGRMISEILRPPAGVAGIIVPWNSPLMLGAWNIAPALAVGCTVVLKAPLWAPLALLQLGRMAKKAGIPSGVLNIIPGDVEAGKTLVSHPDVDRISFTGSAEVGKQIQIDNAKVRLAPVLLELGGKAANIIFDDADLNFTVKGCALSALRSQGQSCVAGTRMLAHSSIHNEFVKKLVRHVGQMKIGNHMDDGTDFGPLITKEHVHCVESQVALARQQGVKLLCGGARSTYGNFFPPTIFSGVTPEMTIFKEEIFGPVITITPFETEEEAIALTNATRYGLSSNVWTADGERYNRVAQQLKVGMVWQNSHFLRDLNIPFGGMKESGVGRAGGRYSLEFFTETKTVHHVHY